MIIVTGMHRSGTSCITGLLSLCGFSLGTSHPLLNDSLPDNEKGHFENLGAVAINERILMRAGGSWDNPPLQKEIADASEAFAGEIRGFSETFNGDVFKDPRICLIVSEWEGLCSGKLDSIVLCLRHPMSVAMSLLKRNNIPIEAGLDLWTRYNASIIEGVSKTPLIVVDYDNLRSNLQFELGCLMEALGKKLSAEELVELTEGFYSEELNHSPFEQNRDIYLPDQINALYQAIHAKTFTVNKRDGVIWQKRHNFLDGTISWGRGLSQMLSSSTRRMSKTIAYLRSLKIFHS